jgi:hypothetical protein
MATYSEVRTKFKDRLRRRDCTDALADGFLSDAIKRIQRVARVPAQEATVSTTLDSTNYGTDGILYLPNDFIQMREVTANDQFTLIRKPLNYVLQMATAQSGTPLYYARRLNGLIFAPEPLLDETEIRIDYWADFPEFNSTDDTPGYLSDSAEDLLVYGALSYACDHWEDKRAPRCEERFVQILSDIQTQADMDELSEASVAQAFAYPSDE